MAETLSRPSSSMSPSLNVRTFLPTPPAVFSGGSPKRTMNSSLSCGSMESFPITDTTALADMSESSFSIEKSSLLNRHFSSLRAEWPISRETISSMSVTMATR